jgi:signal transduction histidine kinase
MELQLIPGDARSVIRSAVDTVRPLAGDKGLALRLELANAPLPLVHDPARLRQVILNLVGNAVKYTDSGEVAVRAWRDDDRGEIWVVVADTGIGIPRERQARLFSTFAQLDGSYAKRRPGAGLGLSISKGLIERMGGTIVVESDGANRGTQVRISFPAHDDPGDVATTLAGAEEDA